ncbi:hypothetical protein K439DRAFT_1332386, partial [Ramaria rubella]
ELSEPSMFAVTMLTKKYGVIPGYQTSLYCHHCHTCYYYNFRVHLEARFLTYYLGVPAFIHISQRFFIETELCDIFTTMMNCVTSATNCACIYNVVFTPPDIACFILDNWQPKLTLYYGDVWNSFFIHGLLLDHSACGTVLQISNGGSSPADRLHPVLEARNDLMMGFRQPERNHSCEKCTHVFDGPDGGPRE